MDSARKTLLQNNSFYKPNPNADLTYRESNQLWEAVSTIVTVFAVTLLIAAIAVHSVPDNKPFADRFRVELLP